MKPSKTLFYKTVRRDGSSVWAHVNPVLGRIYEIGKSYTFPENAPAFGFTEESTEQRIGGNFKIKSFVDTWNFASEFNPGFRILICIGTGSVGSIYIRSVCDLILSKRSRTSLYLSFPAFLSTEFEVIGELCVPTRT